MPNSEYLEIRTRAMREGWHHWHRIAASRSDFDLTVAYRAALPGQRGKPFREYSETFSSEKVEVHHAVPFTDPYDMDVPVKILHPSPRFISELMSGGIHPPIEAHHNKMLHLKWDGGEVECKAIDAPAIRAQHRIISEVVIDNSAVHLTVAMPMSYEQAIEYCILKDIPADVWRRKHNRPHFAIVPRSALPKDRTHRNTWKLKEIAA